MEKQYQKKNKAFYTYYFTEEEIASIIFKYNNLRWGTPKIAAELNVSPTTIASLLKRQGVCLRQDREQALKYCCNEHYFDIVDTEHKAYWIGFLCADGYVYAPKAHCSGKVGIALKQDDIDILKQLQYDLQYTGPIRSYESKTPYGKVCYSRLLVSSSVLYEALNDKGVIPHKTLVLEFPSEDIIPHNLLRHFIRGYLDGDGTITKSSAKSFKISFVGTYQFLKGIAHFFNKDHLALEQKSQHRQQGKNIYTLNIGGNKQVYSILKTLYQDSSIYLLRKKEKADIILQEGEQKYE